MFLLKVNNYLCSLCNDESNYTDYNQQLNTFAAVQEYLMLFINNLTIAQIDSIILQASTLSQLTSPTNELTRDALVRSIFEYFI
jgi:Leucine-rich repeat (LRR) protein